MEEEIEVIVYRSIVELCIKSETRLACESVFSRKELGIHVIFFIEPTESKIIYSAEQNSSRKNYRVVCSILEHEQEFGLIAFQGQGSIQGSIQFYQWSVVDKIREYDDKMLLCFDLIDTSEDCNQIKIAKNSCMLRYLESGELSDFVIRTNEKNFKVHKIVLASRSPVFAAMFRSNMIEAETGVATITNLRTGVMEELLRFMYADVSTYLPEIACDLFAAAHLYDVQDLERLCITRMTTHMSVDNFTGILYLCDRYPLQETKEAALKFIRDNEEVIARREEYLVYLMETVTTENLVDRLKWAQKYELVDLKQHLLEFIASHYKNVIKNQDYRQMYFNESWVNIILEIDEFIADSNSHEEIINSTVSIKLHSKLFVILWLMPCLAIILLYYLTMKLSVEEQSLFRW
ncbi:uncharacterized protein LOC131672710 [Phymastichus coffea]|uniref:uncharacterized protein LOC131672710 n=1 Tax=Phymastichus coffea TaxID=108790 RepID=UPI00273CD922|nr:uncharacterized protein LOC131672710 [Phymastichus coffea]